MTLAFYSGYRQAGGAPGRHRGLPSPDVTFIVTLDDPLMQVALECGYYDQAHLTREFCDMAGCLPSRWVAEELRNIQPFSDELPADSRV